MDISKVKETDEFQDLKLVKFEDSMVQPSQKGPGLMRMPLALSSNPPQGWGPMLEWKCKARLSGNRRTISVEGAYVFVDCAPIELNGILQELKPMVAATNDDYKADQARQEKQRGEQITKEAVEKEQLKNLKNNLKFD